MSPTLTRPPASPARAKPARALLPGLVALLAVYVLLAQSLRMPTVVPHLAIVNPHDWRANVDVTDAGHHGWVRLLGVERNGSRELHDVFDQGDTWVFRFSYGGVDGGEVALTRKDLAAAGWTVTVPDSFATSMRAASLLPSSREGAAEAPGVAVTGSSPAPAGQSSVPGSPSS
jgi:hypothetical protein